VFYTGGEAISEFGLHIPEFDMIAIADEFFTGIPNMHSIRGSKPRIPDNYISALNKVLELEPEWLCPRRRGTRLHRAHVRDTDYRRTGVLYRVGELVQR
jgi:hypothetical protein